MLAVATVGALACMAPVLAATSSRVSWTGVVTYVVDGDTIHVRPSGGGKPVKIRIDGIDAPEICQAGGTAAHDALKRQVLGQRVVVQSKAGDGYGRLVARIVMNKQDQGEVAGFARAGLVIPLSGQRRPLCRAAAPGPDRPAWSVCPR